MTVAFWGIAGLLTAVALVAVLPTLWGGRRDWRDNDRAEANLAVHRDRLEQLKADRERGALSPEAFESAKAELEDELARELPGSDEPAEEGSPGSPLWGGRWPSLILAIAIPLLVAGIYLGVGRPDLLSQPPAARMPASEAQRFLQMPTSERIPALKNYLNRHPRQGEGWFLLGRAHRMTGQYDKAVQAFRRAHDLMGEQPDILANYAEALSLANKNGVPKRAFALAERALAAEPNHRLALWLAGSGAMFRGEKERAAELWRRLARQLPSGSEEARLLRGYIAQAEGVAREHVSIEREDRKRGASGAKGPQLTVRVSLSDSVQDRAQPEDTVFVFARPAQGRPMPLAAVRKKVKDLPLEVTLSDAQAMQPSRTLSQAGRVVIGARISRSGQPMPKSGDLQGLTNPIPVEDGTQTEVTIDRVIP